jgi:hypothetical protein
MAKKAATVFGVVFVLLGILGFFNDPVLGVFNVNTLHNLVHIILGLILLVGANKNPSKSLMVVGVVYLFVAILGFIMVPDGGMLLGLVEINGADNWLHIVLALLLIGASKKR